jgi:polyisoprenoid-binding protein YceI
MRTIMIALSLAIAPCAAAQDTAPTAPGAVTASSPFPAALPRDSSVSLNPADAPAGEYRLDPRHASVIWRVRHTGVGTFVARFDTIAATITFDPEAPTETALEASIAAASVSTGVLNQQGERAFDREIADVLGAEAAPQITFTSRSATQTSPTAGFLTGDLSLNGQTHPATFEVTFQGGRFVTLRGKHVLSFSARTIIDRTQWGVGSLVFNRFAGNEVEILIEAEFVKA